MPITTNPKSKMARLTATPASSYPYQPLRESLLAPLLIPLEHAQITIYRRPIHRNCLSIKGLPQWDLRFARDLLNQTRIHPKLGDGRLYVLGPYITNELRQAMSRNLSL